MCCGSKNSTKKKFMENKPSINLFTVKFPPSSRKMAICLKRRLNGHSISEVALLISFCLARYFFALSLLLSKYTIDRLRPHLTIISLCLITLYSCAMRTIARPSSGIFPCKTILHKQCPKCDRCQDYCPTLCG